MNTLVCLRRDLRLEDNAALYYALKKNRSVKVIFIFDDNILNNLEDKKDARITFIHQRLKQINQQLIDLGSSLFVYYGKPLQIIEEILNNEKVNAFYCNHDYEPYALKRDNAIQEICKQNNIAYHSFKDQVIFEKNEILKKDATPYAVFTPYSKQWKLKLNDFYLKAYPTEKYFKHLIKTDAQNIPTLNEIGFEQSEQEIPSSTTNTTIIKNYDKTRDFPAIKGTTRLSVHLRFGTISIRQLAAFALKHNETYLNELIWREFYMMILWHHPIVVNNCFKPKYEAIKWRNNEAEFEKWCNGQTGIPIVDAGMRELNQTGFMHNRVRMIVASFLVKNLLIDWRWGEAYFANKLLDFDLAANNGGWQWAAGCGCDAAPYFRIFNPESQTKKFDPNLAYIKKWVPEFNDPFTYPKAMVDLKATRKRAIEVYKAALN